MRFEPDRGFAKVMLHRAVYLLERALAPRGGWAELAVSEDALVY
jgi:hypothetical protein